MRQLLREFFRSCRVFGLPPPVENTQQAFTVESVTSRFEAAAQELREAICETLLEPRQASS